MRSYRFSDYIMEELNEVKDWYPEWTETEIIERAIDLLNALEGCKDDIEYYPARLMDGRRLYLGFEKK